MIRATTNGVLKGYRYNLQRSSYTLNQARNTVLTQRNFNTYADDPATAARCFQMRRSFQRANSQYAVGESVVRKYEQAWSAMESVIQDVDNRLSDSAYTEVLKGINDPTASGRPALGQSLSALARGIVQTMNCRYGDNFVFAGADGLKVPFSWDENGNLCYRGVSVDAAGSVPDIQRNTAGDPLTFDEDGNQDPNGTYYKTTAGDATVISKDEYEQMEKDAAALEYMAKDEVKYADIGLGLQEDEDGNVIGSSAFNVALQGSNFLGYGVDEDGDSKNIVSIIARMGEILQNCDATTGAFAEGEREEFQRLANKFEESASLLKDKYTELDTESGFLKSNQAQLENNAYNLQEQFLGVEDADLADAITAFSWAQYCYNAALKVGNSILSQSLMDYIST